MTKNARTAAALRDIRRYCNARGLDVNAVMDAYMAGTLAGMNMEAVVRITVRYDVWGTDVYFKIHKV